MWRVGLAGLGFMGQTHLAQYLKIQGVRVEAIASDDPQFLIENRMPSIHGNMETLAKGLELDGIRKYAHFSELCADDGLDAISICLPSDLHAEAAVQAMEAGKHVFCEKPMALGQSQCERMIAAAEANGRLLMVGHCLRFWPEYEAVERLISSGRYGRTLAASFSRCGGAPSWSSWFTAPERSGGPLLDLHIHDADLCVWWWGQPERIAAQGARVGGVHSVVHSHWVYAGGPVVQFEAAWEPVPTVPFFYGFKVSLERATLIFDSRNGQGLQIATAEGVEKVQVEEGSAYERQDRYFFECLEQGRAADRCPASQSLLAVACIERELAQIAAAEGTAPAAVDGRLGCVAD